MTTYDMSIHTNPDARAWAKFFCEKYKVWSDDGVEIDSEELMIAWFANAMMAMHDHLMLKGAPINGDHAQYLLEQGAGKDDTKDAEDEFNRGIEACMSRLYEMHRIATERHNLYHHAALELAKLKEQS